MTKSATVFHYGGWGRNFGDLLIAHSVRKALRSKASGSINFVGFDLKDPDTPFTQQHVDWINTNCQMFLFGSGGFFMQGDGFTTETGWQLNISQSLWDQIKVPKVAWGMGYNVFDPQKGLSSETWANIAHVAESCAIFTVREQHTSKILTEKCSSLKNTAVVPDPVMFAYKPNELSVNIPAYPRIGLNFAGDRIRARFGSSCEMYDYCEAVCSSLKHNLAGRNVQFVWMPHVELYDNECLFTATKVLEDALVQAKDLDPMLSSESFDRVWSFANLYNSMDMSFGMRGHSHILPYGLGVPTVVLGGHYKSTQFATDYSVPVVPHDNGSAAGSLAKQFLDKHNMAQDYQASRTLCMKIARKAHKDLIHDILALLF